MSTDVLSSATAGLLISCRAGEPPVVKNVLSESTLLPWHALSHVDDWNTQEGVDEATVAALMSEARLQRAVGLAVAALTLASERLASRIVDELERLLQVGVKGGDVLRELVVAPLLHSSNADGLAQLSLASGNAGLADLFDQLGDLQPLIRRFSERWLALRVPYPGE